jgi:uncharacterized protein (TIGR02246 family)
LTEIFAFARARHRFDKGEPSLWSPVVEEVPMPTRSAFVVAFVAVLFVVASGVIRADAKPEHVRIRELDAQWVEAIRAKDAQACAAFYAEDGRIMPQNAPGAQGTEAIAEVWRGFFLLKDFALTFEPTRIVVAQAGDVAYDIGSYSLAFEGEQGLVRDRGKYVVVWRKVGSDWKVAADIFNSDGTVPAE